LDETFVSDSPIKYADLEDEIAILGLGNIIYSLEDEDLEAETIG
jgi:hypothetical protein